MCLNRFCVASGQAVSFEKSAIFCSKNVDRRIASTISATLGIPLTQDLGRYLGVPVLHERVTKHTYQDVIDELINASPARKQNRLPWRGESPWRNQSYRLSRPMQCKLRFSRRRLVKPLISVSVILFGAPWKRQGIST
ncbi:hypothetical protein LINPERHAP1_LOCUS13106 [Linum perenne]